MKIRFLLLLTLLPALLRAEPKIEQDASALRVTLDNGATLEFALENGTLLGLRKASVGGVSLKSEETVVRPVIADEYGPNRLVWDVLKFREAKADGDGADIVADLIGSADEAACRSVFVFTGDPARAAKGLTPELKALEAKAKAAEQAMEPFLAQHERWARTLADQAKAQEKLDAGKDVEEVKKEMAGRVKRMAEIKPEIMEQVVAKNPEAAKVYADITAFKEALDKRSLDFGRIHRDCYEFAMTRLPAEICALDFVKGRAAAASSAKPTGTLHWIVKPAKRTIAGWPWKGWSQSYRFELANGNRVNCVRQFGTWEIGGNMDGLTVVNMRYRGLGAIEQKFTGGKEGIHEAFTTTEILPGAVGKAPVVSPAVPSGADIKDRGFALRHRAGAWIAHPGRGAGTAFVDFQYRPNAILISTFEKQGNLRALTEAFPGDKTLSQTDDFWFPLASSGETPEQLFLALVPAKPFAVNEARTRWQEVDQHFRDVVSKELGLVQYEPEPAVGCNIDNAFGQNVAGLGKRMDEFAKLGVKQVIAHHPGWQNGRDREPGSPDLPGGDCAIFDWKPLTNVQQPWKDLTRAAAKNQIAYYAWVTGMSIKNGPFYNEVGADPKHWAINAPGKTESSGYGGLYDHNIFDERCRTLLLGRLDAIRKDYGMQGVWADSFQNLFMSTLDWANGTGAPMQRAWWEQIAAWSRQGIGWISESHAFPCMSCSIELDTKDDNAAWFMQHVSRWFRVDFPNPGTPAADRMAFRFMANKGWAAPQVQYGKKPEASIPSFGRIAAEYNAALPMMRRSYILPGEGGVLWLSYKDNKEGVWFAFSEQAVPANVTANYIIDNAPATKAEALKTYRVKGADLLKAFNVLAGPEADERLGRPYEKPKYNWPDWAK